MRFRLIKLKGNEELYRIAEIVSQIPVEGGGFEVNFITWPGLFTTKKAAINEIETSKKIKFTFEEYQTIKCYCWLGRS